MLPRLERGLLLAVMVVGGFATWVAVPIAWLWIASRLAESQQPTAGGYALVLAGIGVSIVVLTRLLGVADRRYRALRGELVARRAHLPWLKSMRGERTEASGHSVLEVVMVASVGIAGVALAIWFFGVAGSPLPG